jgi:hypothetical protein
MLRGAGATSDDCKKQRLIPRRLEQIVRGFFILFCSESTKVDIQTTRNLVKIVLQLSTLV